MDTFLATESQTLKTKVRENMYDLILRQQPKRVWMYGKHRRWMLSREYRILQEKYIGIGPMFEAKTKLFFNPGPEDKTVTGKPHRFFTCLLSEFSVNLTFR